MRAAVIRGLGSAEVLEVQEVSPPAPLADTVIVRVVATSVNWLDVLMRIEDFGMQFPHIPGSDVAGVVEAIDGRGDLSPGDEVVVNPGICVTPEDRRYVRILGLHLPGGYGELVQVPARQVYRKPAHLTMEQAAAFPLTYLTAWRMLVTRAKVNEGDTVFVWGASGSLGTAGVQIAKAHGARVLAAIGREEFSDELLALGADEVVPYRDCDVVARVRQLTDSRGADLVFESIGSDTWAASVGMLAQGGRIVIAGTKTGAMASTDLSEVYYHQVSILGSRMGYPEEFAEMLQWVEKQRIVPAVGRAYHLSDVREAHRCIENRDVVGKILLLHG